jgi:hypothetical protein
VLRSQVLPRGQELFRSSLAKKSVAARARPPSARRARRATGTCVPCVQGPGPARGPNGTASGSPARARCALRLASSTRHVSVRLVPVPARPLAASILRSGSGLSVWLLLTTRARRWAPPRAAVTRWRPSTDPASSTSVRGATTARYPLVSLRWHEDVSMRFFPRT